MDSLILSPNEAELLAQLRQELGMFKTDDPYIVQLISTLNESVILFYRF